MSLTHRESKVYAIGNGVMGVISPASLYAATTWGFLPMPHATAGAIGGGVTAALFIYLASCYFIAGDQPEERKQRALDVAPAEIDADAEATDDGILVALYDSANPDPMYYAPTDAAATADALQDALKDAEVSA